MNFNDYINKETETITGFCQTNKEIEIEKIYNEGFSKFDFTFISGNTNTPFKINGICEVKTRNVTSDYYAGGCLIQLDKYKSLIDIVSKCKNKEKNINKDIRAFYLVRYTDKDLLFDLNHTKMDAIKFENCPKHTASNGNNTYEFKPVFYIDPQQAIN
ncbi:hypothetical protein [Pseudotamlana agarivorans]|uniref:hypothetical protein n=1 Tax=Pseudotamlana agarivorans TaxID=481183 RepID=UPI0008361A85|nr:hypothetical protein [Tamlana agarivorans]